MKTCKYLVYLLVLVFCLLMLSGCLTSNATIMGALQKARQVADAELAIAEFGVCDMPTAGALRRRYGYDKKAAETWQDFCRREGVPVYPISEEDLK